MKKKLLLFIILVATIQVSAQNFTGQWKGYFMDKSTSFIGWGGDRCDYVLEIECKGNDVTGYSYTYFSEAGKRYYTICKLKGKINPGSKYIEVTETERTKTNIPSTIRNCFQVHRLTYFQKGEDQSLEGTWVPAPKQKGDCGYGSTVLSRRVLQKNSLLPSKNPATKPNMTISRRPPVKNQSAIPPLKTVPKADPGNKKITTPPELIAKSKPNLNQSVVKESIPETKTKVPADEIKKTGVPQVEKMEVGQKKNAIASFEKRNSNLIKTIDIENETFTVDLYDNGDIDGDSISLFFNGKLLIARKRLSDKAISLTLNIDPKKEINELVMYADNLGAIPPNTALMIVTDGTRRYEARISSDFDKSGVIRFVHKSKQE